MELPRTTVLLVEDNPGDARLLKELLADAGATGLTMIWTERLTEGLARLQAGGIDVILLDLSLPDATGMDTVTRTHATAPEVPIVVLTGLDDENAALQAMKWGVQDYLVKGQVHSQLLVRAIRYAIERKRAEEGARRLLREQAARIEAEQAAARSRLLAEASRVLASSLDRAATVGAIARLAVPVLADRCFIDLADDGGGALRLPAEEPLPDEASVLDRISVPLAARGCGLGTITLLRLTSGAKERYSPDDRALAEELGGRVALSLDNARLHRDREDMMGIVSHDLRNPLNVINFCASVLEQDHGSPASRLNHVEIIKRSVTRMNRLIENLLDMTRIEGGRLVVEPVRHEVAALVHDVSELFCSLAEQKGVAFDLRIREALPAVYADHERALQVFSNLIGNAIKFAPKGSSVVLEAVLGDGEVRFSVTDSGPGIRPEDLPRIFDRFWQGDRAGQEGAGLGLSIAKGIILAHGGRIWVESKLGAGSTFSFTLPVFTETGATKGAGLGRDRARPFIQ